MAGQYDNLIGELTPGQSGWLPLDEAGVPNGPATIQPPPGPNAKACSVKANAQTELDAGHDALVSSTGASLSPPLTSNVDRRYPNDPASSVPPVVSGISPSTAECGAADIEMTVSGQNFTATSVITFNGLDEPTDFFSSTSLGTGVKPSLFVVPAVCPVAVRDAAGTSNSVNFEFTAPVGRDAGSRRK